MKYSTLDAIFNFIINLEQRDQLVDEVMEKREDSDDDEAWRMLGQNHLPDKCSLIKVVQPQVVCSLYDTYTSFEWPAI